MNGSPQSPPGADGGSSAQRPDRASGGDSLQRQRRIEALASGMDLYLELEDLAEAWLERVCGTGLSRHEAILALLAGLNGGLQQQAPSR